MWKNAAQDDENLLNDAFLGIKSKFLPFCRFLTFPQKAVDWKTLGWKLRFYAIFYPNRRLSTAQNQSFEQLRKVNKINTLRPLDTSFATPFPLPFPHAAQLCGKPVDNLLFSPLFKKSLAKTFIATSSLSQYSLTDFQRHTTNCTYYTVGDGASTSRIEMNVTFTSKRGTPSASFLGTSLA